MPAAYTHLTLANVLAARRDVHPSLLDATDRWLPFVELGAVSPDLPYLVLGPGSEEAAAWADDMHTRDGGAIIQAGVQLLSQQPADARERCLAWLLGYASHVTADVVIHPVVNLIAGEPYADHKLEHRTCEMHQDVHIWGLMNLGPIGVAEHLDNGVRRCGTDEGIDPAVSGYWRAILQRVHEGRYAASAPNIDLWFRRFIAAVDKIAEEGGRLLPLARHVAEAAGLVYPPAPDDMYIRNIPTPAGRMDYDAVFDKAVGACLNVWADIAAGITGQPLALVEAGWNLDTGRSTSPSHVFWS